MDTTADIAAAWTALGGVASTGGQIDVLFERKSRTYTLELTIEDCPASAGTPYGRRVPAYCRREQWLVVR